MPFGHRHETQEEVYVVVAGSGRFKLDDDIVEVGQWDAVRVDPEVTRGSRGRPGRDRRRSRSARPATGLQDAEQEMGWWTD